MFIRSIGNRKQSDILTGLLFIAGAYCAFAAGPAQAQPEPPLRPIVRNTNDIGPGSLREALQQAQTRPETVVTFNIPKTDPNFKDGVFTIALEHNLPRVRLDGTIIDGTSQTAFTGDTNPAGPEIVIRSAANQREVAGNINDVGLAISAKNCGVRGLTINRYHHTILIDGKSAAGNEIVGCYLGTSATGTNLPPEELTPLTMLSIRGGANNNVIGGTTPEQRNVMEFIAVFGTGTIGNIIQGNYVGLSADGVTPFGRITGINIGQGATQNLIGGTKPGTRNVIVGRGSQGAAIVINGEGTDDNIVQGNYIGTDKDGTTFLSRSPFGMFINAGPKNNQVGGTTPEARNVIANHESGAVTITFATGNLIQGNYAGIDATGTKAIGNGAGRAIQIAPGNTAGSEGAARNLTYNDIRPKDAPAAAPPTSVAPVPPAAPAPMIAPVPRVGEAPVIAEPAAEGPRIIVTSTGDQGPGTLRQALTEAQNTPGTTVVFNIPNTDPNFKDGVFTIRPETYLPTLKANGTVIDGTSQTAFTGDTNPNGPEIVLRGGKGATKGTDGLRINAARCVLKSLVINSEPGSLLRMGLRIAGAEASENRIIGCYIGINATGTIAQPNDGGVKIERGAHHNIIGGTTAAERNVISGNRTQELLIAGAGAGTDSNFIQGNYFGLTADGTKLLVNNGAINITEGAKNNVIGGPSPATAPDGSRNVICAGGAEVAGITINVRGTDNNFVQGNYIGTDAQGNTALGTSGYGIMLNAYCRNNVIGGTTLEARNVIANHRDSAVTLTFCSNNFVQGNFIGTDPTGRKVVGSGLNGISVYASPSNVLGGAEAGAGNLINGNSNNGIALMGDPGEIETTNNLVQGNIIGADATGAASPGSQRIGVGIYGTSYKHIIGLAPDGSGRGNMIVFHSAKPADGSTVLPLQGGVVVETDEKGKAAGNTIRGNAIYNNGGAGINLKLVAEADNTATPNDAGDADGGPNNGQNYPVIVSVRSVAGKTVVKGSLDSTPNTDFIIDLYRNSKAHASGYGEGEMPKAMVKVTTDAKGHADFVISPFDETGGEIFTVTATNIATGDTSEFSKAVKIQ